MFELFFCVCASATPLYDTTNKTTTNKKNKKTVLDGVDGFVLGAECLRGDYPLDSVAIIAQISRSAER